MNQEQHSSLHSEQQPRGGIGAFLKDRTLIALVLAAVIVLSLAYLRQNDITGLSPDSFFVLKTTWSDCADIVLAGDSRIYRGLSPEEIGRSLPGRKILNFGFSAAAYSTDYLNAVENVLHRKGDNRAVVLGIAPWCLTPGAIADNGFREYFDKKETERFMTRYFGDIYYRFRPFDYSIDRGGIHVDLGIGKNIEHYYQRFGNDGWAESYRVPEHSYDVAIKAITKAHIDAGPVSQEAVDTLLNRVKKWVGEGVAVYGFRPPTFPERVALEDSLSHFNSAAFVEAFTEAGGRWLDVDQGAYHTYDGSHLHFKDARRLSFEMGQWIANGGKPGVMAGSSIPAEASSYIREAKQ